MLDLALFDKLVLDLRSARLDCSTEADLQQSVQNVLMNRYSHGREYRLSDKDVVDFLVKLGDEYVAVECKVGGQPLRNHRQVERYLKHESVKGAIIVTSKHMGTTGEHLGKPIRVVKVGEAWL